MRNIASLASQIKETNGKEEPHQRTHPTTQKIPPNPPHQTTPAPPKKDPKKKKPREKTLDESVGSRRKRGLVTLKEGGCKSCSPPWKGISLVKQDAKMRKGLLMASKEIRWARASKRSVQMGKASMFKRGEKTHVIDGFVFGHEGGAKGNQKEKRK